jgi:hypothetical protein
VTMRDKSGVLRVALLSVVFCRKECIFAHYFYAFNIALSSVPSLLFVCETRMWLRAQPPLRLRNPHVASCPASFASAKPPLDFSRTGCHAASHLCAYMLAAWHACILPGRLSATMTRGISLLHRRPTSRWRTLYPFFSLFDTCQCNPYGFFFPQSSCDFYARLNFGNFVERRLPLFRRIYVEPSMTVYGGRWRGYIGRLTKNFIFNRNWIGSTNSGHVAY